MYQVIRPYKWQAPRRKKVERPRAKGAHSDVTADFIPPGYNPLANFIRVNKIRSGFYPGG